ncbi:hypothetical protein BT63DRAFT_65144 [Microthyrium microscopicum]|uniref:Uncharacterized protein n=1 Tax=Microthyrium microscopicum TaxID=703497 RepID=A0A6A6U2P7_9PEZI|nr:hypothetical protein BT63DRAFT_65144 [Microthyrium microscopicum]
MNITMYFQILLSATFRAHSSFFIVTEVSYTMAYRRPSPSSPKSESFPQRTTSSSSNNSRQRPAAAPENRLLQAMRKRQAAIAADKAREAERREADHHELDVQEYPKGSNDPSARPEPSTAQNQDASEADINRWMEQQDRWMREQGQFALQATAERVAHDADENSSVTATPGPESSKKGKERAGAESPGLGPYSSIEEYLSHAAGVIKGYHGYPLSYEEARREILDLSKLCLVDWKSEDAKKLFDEILIALASIFQPDETSLFNPREITQETTSSYPWAQPVVPTTPMSPEGYIPIAIGRDIPSGNTPMSPRDKPLPPPPDEDEIDVDYSCIPPPIDWKKVNQLPERPPTPPPREPSPTPSSMYSLYHSLPDSQQPDPTMASRLSRPVSDLSSGHISAHHFSNQQSTRTIQQPIHSTKQSPSPTRQRLASPHLNIIHDPAHGGPTLTRPNVQPILVPPASRPHGPSPLGPSRGRPLASAPVLSPIIGSPTGSSGYGGPSPGTSPPGRQPQPGWGAWPPGSQPGFQRNGIRGLRGIAEEEDQFCRPM